MPGHLGFLRSGDSLLACRAVRSISDASFRPYSFASLPFGSFALFNCHGCRGDGCPEVETIGILTKYHFDNIIPPLIYASEKAPIWRAPLFKFIKICAALVYTSQQKVDTSFLNSRHRGCFLVDYPPGQLV